MLQVLNVSKSYEQPGTDGSTEVLHNINLKLTNGQSISVVGPSGSGKSTLLNIIGTLDRPTSGKVIFDKRNLAELGDNELADIRNREIGFVFQLHHLLPQCTVIENVLIPTLAHGQASDRQAYKRARKLLDRVGLADFPQHRPGELSGGQRQRVAVVRALINEPKLLLADEPTGSLDKESSENVAELLKELNQQQGLTMLVVTHSIQLAERVGEVMNLSDGRLTKGGGE